MHAEFAAHLQQRTFPSLVSSGEIANNNSAIVSPSFPYPVCQTVTTALLLDKFSQSQILSDRCNQGLPSRRVSCSLHPCYKQHIIGHDIYLQYAMH